MEREKLGPPDSEQAEHAVPEADCREVALGCHRRIKPWRGQHLRIEEHLIVPVVVKRQGAAAVLAGRFHVPGPQLHQVAWLPVSVELRVVSVRDYEPAVPGVDQLEHQGKLHRGQFWKDPVAAGLSTFRAQIEPLRLAALTSCRKARTMSAALDPEEVR